MRSKAAEARRRWNARYRSRTPHFEPASLLVEHAHLLTGGRALDVACGTGGNAFFLATRGYRVDAVDISEVGLALAQEEAQRRGLSRHVRFIQADAARLPLTPQRVRYDCIVVFRFLLRPLIPTLRCLLKPGGLIFYNTFNVRRLESHPEFAREFLLELGELPTWFPGFEVITAYEQGEVSAFVGRAPENGLKPLCFRRGSHAPLRRR